MPGIHGVFEDFFQYVCQTVLTEALLGEHEVETLN